MVQTNTKRESEMTRRRAELERQLQLAASKVSPDVKAATEKVADRYQRLLEKLAST